MGTFWTWLGCHFLGLSLAGQGGSVHSWSSSLDRETAPKSPPSHLGKLSLASPSSSLLVCPLLSTWARNPTGWLLFLPGAAMASGFSRGSVRGGAAVRDALSSREFGLRPQGIARQPSQPSWMKEALRWGTQQGSPPPCVNATTISVSQSCMSRYYYQWYIDSYGLPGGRIQLVKAGLGVSLTGLKSSSSEYCVSCVPVSGVMGSTGDNTSAHTVGIQEMLAAIKILL